MKFNKVTFTIIVVVAIIILTFLVTTNYRINKLENATKAYAVRIEDVNEAIIKLSVAELEAEIEEAIEDECVILASPNDILEQETIVETPIIEIEEIIDNNTDLDNLVEETGNEPENTEEEVTEVLYSASDLKYLGVFYWGGYKWTWYSEKVLPGGGLDIPGRHLDENGYVCDEDNYICLASGSIAKGTVVSTPLGKNGKIYDYCVTPGVLDVYVGW